MQKLSKPTRELRYRAYFWLMDISLVAIAIGAVDFFADQYFATGFSAFLPPPWVYVVALPVLFVNFVVPMFLICARFMRDEYAEGLWLRTSVVLAYATAALPLIFFILAWGWYFATGHTDAKLVHWSLRWMADEVQWGRAIMLVWLAYMMLFVVIFQILRWRDSR